jgi:flagellar hook-basal body complex protein FliE
MAINTINNVLEQIQYQSKQISSSSGNSPLNALTEKETAVPFSSVLMDSLNGISHMQKAAQHQARDFMMGDTDIGLNDVMVDMQKSSLALSFGIQARNKMVSAYQEIMSMGI